MLLSGSSARKMTTNVVQNVIKVAVIRSGGLSLRDRAAPADGRAGDQRGETDRPGRTYAPYRGRS